MVDDQNFWNVFVSLYFFPKLFNVPSQSSFHECIRHFSPFIFSKTVNVIDYVFLAKPSKENCKLQHMFYNFSHFPTTRLHWILITMQLFEKSLYSSNVKFQIILIIVMKYDSFNIKFKARYIAIFTDGNHTIMEYLKLEVFTVM